MPRPDVFTLGGCIDFDEGGWVVPIASERLAHCIADKSIKIDLLRSGYPTWWLIIPDYTGCAIGALEDKQERPMVVDLGAFERVIFIDPYRPTCAADV